MLETGIKKLDNYLGGGLKSKKIYELYGEFASGKTTLTMQISILNNKKTLFINASNNFSAERYKQIAKGRNHNEKKALSKILILNYSKPEKLIKNIKQIIDSDFDLIILDTFSTIYREYKKQKEKLKRYLKFLTWTARSHDLTVLISNQVFTGSNNRLKPVGEHSIDNWVNDRIKIEKLDNSRRSITLEKINGTKKEFNCKLTQKGLLSL